MHRTLHRKVLNPDILVIVPNVLLLNLVVLLQSRAMLGLLNQVLVKMDERFLIHDSWEIFVSLITSQCVECLGLTQVLLLLHFTVLGFQTLHLSQILRCIVSGIAQDFPDSFPTVLLWLLSSYDIIFRLRLTSLQHLGLILRSRAWFGVDLIPSHKLGVLNLILLENWISLQKFFMNHLNELDILISFL